MARLLVAGLLLAAAAPLLAQPRRRAPAAPHAPMRATTMTRAEVQAARRRRISRKLDANRDGFLTDRGNDAPRRQRDGANADARATASAHARCAIPTPRSTGSTPTATASISRDEFAKAREVRIEKRVVIARQASPATACSGMRGMRGGGGDDGRRR